MVLLTELHNLIGNISLMKPNYYQLFFLSCDQQHSMRYLKVIDQTGLEVKLYSCLQANLFCPYLNQ